MERVILYDNKENPEKGRKLIFDSFKDTARIRLLAEKQEIYNGTFSEKDVRRILILFQKILKKM